MQDIYIYNITMKNCRCHYEMEMDFPIDSFTVIQGKNGAGKSTIPKAVSMGLYGDDGAPPGDKITIADMVNRKTGKDLEIKTYFRVVDSDTNTTDEYRTELYYEHKKFHNQFFLFKNDIPITGKTKADTYKLIEKILYPKDIYHNVINFSQQVKNFFTSLTNTQQKEIFDSVLQTKVYNTYYKNAFEVEGVLKKDIQDVTISIDKIKQEIEWKSQSIERLISDKELAEKKKQDSLDSHKLTKTRLENEIQLIAIQINEMGFDSNKLDQLKTEIIILRQKLDQVSKTLFDDLDKSDNKKSAEIVVINNDFINRCREEIQVVKDSCEVKLEKLRNDKADNYLKISEISKKYDTTPITKDCSDFEREKQKEIQQVNFSINQLEVEFSTSTLEHEKETRLGIIEKNAQDLRDNASELKSDAASIKTNIDEKQLSVTKDEESLLGESPTCSKCLRPFTSDEDIEIIKKDISKGKAIIIDLNVQFKSIEDKMVVLKAEFKECTEVKDKARSDYDDKINDVKIKKNKRAEEFQRKLELLNNEIVEYRRISEVKINELKSNMDNETEVYRTRQLDIDTRSADIQSKCDIDETEIANRFDLERQNKQSEHNKKYIQLQTDITNSSKSKSEVDSARFSVVESQIKIESDAKIQYDILVDSKNGKGYELDNVKTNIINIENEEDIDDTRIEVEKSEKLLIEQKHIDEIAKRGLIERELEILLFWKKSFSDTGIKSMLIDMAIPHMNESVAEALEKIAPGIFTVSFDTLSETKSGDIRDKFKVKVLHNIKGTDSHKMLSGGEKRMVDLACMEALRSLTERLYNKRIHNLFYDEVLDSLDADNRQIFCQLSKLISRDKNVTLITHNTAEDMEPDRIFKI